MRLNQLGRIVEETWTALPEHYLHVQLDIFVVMPNHAHGVILMVDHDALQVRTGAILTTGKGSNPAVGAGFKPAPTKSKRHALPEIVRAFKTFSSRRINLLRGTVGTYVWQRGYYDRIIRTEAEFNRIKDYILGNPRNWDMDSENPFGEAPHPGARDLEV